MRAARSKARTPKWPTFTPPQWQDFIPPLTPWEEEPPSLRHLVPDQGGGGSDARCIAVHPKQGANG